MAYGTWCMGVSENWGGGCLMCGVVKCEGSYFGFILSAPVVWKLPHIYSFAVYANMWKPDIEAKAKRFMYK